MTTNNQNKTQKVSKAPSKALLSKELASRSQKKKECNVISRIFYEDRLSVPEGIPRLTAIAYTLYRDRNEIRYAASLFKEDKPNEMVNVFGNKSNLKKALRETAEERLRTKWLTMAVPKDSDWTINETHHIIRIAVAQNGSHRGSKNSSKSMNRLEKQRQNLNNNGVDTNQMQTHSHIFFNN